MFLIRKTAKLSFPAIGSRMGKRNHSTVISACRRMEHALAGNEKLTWNSSIGEREEEARHRACAGGQHTENHSEREPLPLEGHNGAEPNGDP